MESPLVGEVSLQFSFGTNTTYVASFVIIEAGVFKTSPTTYSQKDIY